MSQWSVYILRCADGSLYTGITTDVERRLNEHNDSRRGAAYTRARRPVALAYMCDAANRADASRQEYVIKQKSRSAKEQLIGGYDPDTLACGVYGFPNSQLRAKKTHNGWQSNANQGKIHTLMIAAPSHLRCGPSRPSNLLGIDY